ncbi:MAG TPA: hypothetical protein VHS59_07595, partial [Bacillota bacterium]|nr:hypothetical protein [Bacillota bacterium]
MNSTGVEMRRRISLLLSMMSLILLLLMARLAFLQFIQGNQLRNMAIENRLREVPVEARRGTIYDR